MVVIVFCRECIPGSTGRTNRHGCPIYKEEYYQYVKQSHGGYKRTMTTRDRCCCTHSICISIWLLIIMVISFLVSSSCQQGYEQYKPRPDEAQCVVTNVTINDEINCWVHNDHVYVYNFGLTDDYNEINGCSEFIQSDKYCTLEPLYTINDEITCYLDSNNNGKHCDAEFSVPMDYSTEFYLYISGFLVLGIIMILFIYLLVGCMMYERRFVLCWICTHCKVKTANKDAQKQLSQFQRHLQEVKICQTIQVEQE